jgi:hypothetical protein
MPLASGREFPAIPGPTVIPDQVLAAMQRPAVDNEASCRQRGFLDNRAEPL